MHDLPVYIDRDYAYVRMKAYSWIGNKGFMPSTVQASAGKLLSDLIARIDDNMILVVNFQGISHIEDHSLHTVNKALADTKRCTIFTKASTLSVENQISYKPVVTLESGTIIYNNEKPSRQLSQSVEKNGKIEIDIIKHIVSESYKKFDKMERLRSTPILASGVFNAGSIVSDRNKFIWTCLLLTDKLNEIMNQYKPKANVRLLAVSLRASPFAGSIGILESYPIEIVDHMGPDLKILEEYTLRVATENVEYIYVGDFVIGGTELKIAETYAVARGCVIKHAIVIGSLFDPSEYKGTVKVHPVVKLREANPKIRYQMV